MSQTAIPPFHGNISFNAQHSPMGAFFSFTCGQFGSRGGFGLQIGKPGNQNLYIGVKDGDRFSDAPLKCLPFYEGAESDEAVRFDVEKKGNKKKSPLVAYGRDEITRHFGWATDHWITKDFEFAIYTSFGPINERKRTSSDELRLQLIPAVFAELIVDNSTGASPKTAVFAIGFSVSGVRLLDAESTWLTRKGFAFRREYGALGQLIDPAKGGDSEEREESVAAELQTGFRWSAEESVKMEATHLLGSCPALTFTVPAGERRVLKLALGGYVDGVQTTRLEGRYAYARHFGGLEDVLSSALEQCSSKEWCLRAMDNSLLSSGLSPDQQFMIAHATRSYYGSTQLLDVGGQPYWIVNEGEYCMINTLDLSVDHVFWELKQNPWVVKNLLDNFVRHYSYVDQVKDPITGKLSEGGISFAHDQGVHNNFSPFGHSSYELPNLNALCFSYMTAEQLCNWILIAASYVAKTKDLEWAKHNEHVIDACLHSLVNRTNERGFPAYDSSRCGPGGAEITTYDSLDHSLAQTRNNLYMVVKTWAAYRGLALLYEKMGHQHEYHAAATDMAERIEKELPTRAGADGVFPAVFEKENSGYTSRILPACEGLMYPLYWGTLTPSPFVDALKKHTVKLLSDGQNVFPDGGIKLSSTSNNSWMSKIAIFMHVCRKVFKLDEDPAVRDLFAKADAAHVRWQTEGDSAYWACSDQFVNGVAKGSKYYPRIITSALWMEE